MTEIQSITTYFEKAGRENTVRTLQLAKNRSDELGIDTILVASTTGATGAKAVDVFKKKRLIVVSHVCGYDKPNEQELTQENRQKIECKGATILTAQHTMGGLNRAIRFNMQTYQVDEIISNTLRLFGQGCKVVLELAMMATDAGLIQAGTPVVAVGGSHRGADFAAVVNPANSFRFYEIGILEFICMPSMKHPLIKK
jgi:uncharacterized protein